MNKMETTIGNLLRAGVITAAAIVFMGGMVYLFRHGFDAVNYHVFQRAPSYPFFFRGRGLIQLGLLILIATPIARVALSILAFARQRDKLYTIITIIVFCILMYSILHR